MTRYDRRFRALAMFLSAVAGFVDAVAFIQLGGFFVSFMSGNSTRLAVALAEGSSKAALAAGLIVLFMIGVVTGSLVGRVTHHRRAIIVMFVALALTVAAICGAVGAQSGAIAAMALAMGAENAVFEDDGEVRIGLTYMTGTLVKGGQRIAAALMGGERWGWAPYLLQWCGLTVGAVCGALAYPRLGLGSLWIAVAALILAAFAAARLDAGKPRSSANPPL
jgi:uncharacterized membrane protein YoaK (UPF0700 family)